MTRRSKLGAALAVALATAALVAGSVRAADPVTVVSPADWHGWAFAEDDADVGSSTWGFTPGPGTAPLGTGSAQLGTVANDDRPLLGTLELAGTRLDAITQLGYWTYRQAPATGVLAPALQFDVDADVTDGDTAYQGRLVYEPYYTHTVAAGQWQHWDALDDSTNGTWGNWWFSNGTLAGASGCGISTPCTWSQVLAAFPDAGILGATFFKAGSYWPGFVGNVDAFTFGTASGAETFDFEPVGTCMTAQSGSTLTLLADCDVTASFVVPEGFTLDGAGHSITAHDPAGGHFLGAVVRNGGSLVHVTDLEVTASGLANVCDPAAPADTRLRGILLDGAGGSVTDTTVHGVRQGPSGCQEGNAIEVRNLDASGNPAASEVAVTISGNTVFDYQKNGITANGNVAATITGNTVTGDGQVDYIAQNGIQVGFGATALVESNTVSGNWYTPPSYTSCGVLLYEATGVKQRRNDLFANERDLCNFGRGGGTLAAG